MIKKLRFKNIVLKKKGKNEKQLLAIIECQAIIYVCVLFFWFFLCIIVFEHLHVNTPLIYHFFFFFFFWFLFCVETFFSWMFFFVFFFMFHLYIWPVLFPGGELRTWHWPVCCISYFSLSFSFSLPHSRLFIHHI